MVSKVSLRISKTFGSRGTSRNIEARRKYIFVFEGEKTEKQYFEGLFDYREELGIEDIIDIKTLEREDHTRSNQRKIVEEIHQSLSMVTHIKEDKNAIINKLMESSQIEMPCDIESIVHRLFQEEVAASEFIELLERIRLLSDEYEDIAFFIEQLERLKDILDYEEGYDNVCIIIDRDKQSFKEDQYDAVLNICRENQYKLGVTNPCFEFWLLLHKNDCLQLNREELMGNKRVSSRRRYLESLLVSEYGTYQKSKLDFELFKNDVNLAIEREQHYCEEPILLKNELGSSVGLIIKELFKKS